jgi:hypothetical protein
MKLYYVSITIRSKDALGRELGDWATSARRVGSTLVIKLANGSTRIFPIEQVIEWGLRDVTPKEAADMAKITGKPLEA